jgi:glycosyltransferase involved in cell wall biosynthesis
MRVHFVGNVCNDHYILAKAIRRRGIDARLFYDGDAIVQELPESDDPEVAQHPPDWLRPHRRQFKLWQMRYNISQELLRAISDCDILHVHGVELVWAAMTGKPFVWQPYGSDLSTWSHYNRDALIRWHPRPPLPIFPHFLLPPKMQWAMRRASAIILGSHNKLWQRGYDVIHDLGLEDRIARIFLSIDTEKFVPLAQSEKDAILTQLLPQAAIERPVIFHPTRQMFTDPASKRGYKANDRLYRALGRFAREGGKFTLVVVDKTCPITRPHGSCTPNWASPSAFIGSKRCRVIN